MISTETKQDTENICNNIITDDINSLCQIKVIKKQKIQSYPEQLKILNNTLYFFANTVHFHKSNVPKANNFLTSFP